MLSRYYDRKYIEENLSLDDSLVKEYFPVSFVVPAVIEIYSKLLGVQFLPTKADLWHPGESYCYIRLIFYILNE